MTRKHLLKTLISATLAVLPCTLLPAKNIDALGACEASPLPEGSYWLSSPYGMRLHPLDHVWSMHYGVDLACSRGTGVMAIGDGVVSFAGRWSCYGNVVIIRHPGDVLTVYAHLSRFAPAVKRRATVRRGQVIALSGSTGCVTGPHLHFEVWRGQNRQRVNPAIICILRRMVQIQEVGRWHRL